MTSVGGGEGGGGGGGIFFCCFVLFFCLLLATLFAAGGRSGRRAQRVVHSKLAGLVQFVQRNVLSSDHFILHDPLVGQPAHMTHIPSRSFRSLWLICEKSFKETYRFFGTHCRRTRVLPLASKRRPITWNEAIRWSLNWTLTNKNPHSASPGFVRWSSCRAMKDRVVADSPEKWTTGGADVPWRPNRSNQTGELTKKQLQEQSVSAVDAIIGRI